MESKVIMPSESLRPYVNHYWIMRASGNSMDMNIMPMGSMKWIFHRGTPLTINGLIDESNVASICGQYTSAAHVRMHGQTNLIFVFFRPYAMRMITGIPCQLFENDNVPMDSLELPGFKILKEMVLNAPDDDSAIAIIEDFILTQLSRSQDLGYLKRMMTVCSEIDQHIDSPINMLADVACLSERQLRRVFLDYIGLAPKQMVRTRRCLLASRAILNMEGEDLTQLIYQLGFTDHSHLNKEFRSFAGMSPTDYFNHVKDIKRHDLIRGYKAYHE